MSEHTKPPEHSEHTPTEQPVFGMKRAAEVAGVSVSTIRRNRSRLEECGAVISPDGWKVPISALVVSGLMKPTSPAELPNGASTSPQHVAESYSEVQELKRELLELRHRFEIAEERRLSAEQRVQSLKKLADTLIETLQIERRMLLGKDYSKELKGPEQEISETKTHNPLPWWKRISRRRI